MSSETLRNRLHQDDVYACNIMVCISLISSTMHYEEIKLMNIMIWRNMNRVKCCSLTRTDSVWSVTLDILWYGGKGTQNITVQTRWIDSLGRNQRRYTYKPAYYPECYFDATKLCQWYTQTLYRTWRFNHWWFPILMHNNATPQVAHLVKDMLQACPPHLRYSFWRGQRTILT